MTNRDLEAAWSYHDGTKHSWQSIHADSHFLDFPNQPLPFKIYEELEPIPLPKDFSNTGGGGPPGHRRPGLPAPATPSWT